MDGAPVGMTDTEMMEAQEHEGNMSHADKRVAETSEAMNELESFVYAMRDQLATRYEKFATDADREKNGAKLTAVEDWLYEDGADCEKATYVEKLAELKGDVAAIIGREREADERPEAFKALEAAIAKFGEFVASTAEEYAHIDKEQKDKVAAEVEAATAFLAEKKAAADALVPTEEPPFKAADVAAKATALTGTCNPILRTPKPLPKVEPVPEPEAKPAEGDAEPAEGDAAKPEGEAAPAEGEAKPEGEAAEKPPAAAADNMDVD